MTDELKQILCDLIERHGRELVREPKRLDGMLNDACAGKYRGARRVLVDAIRERIVEELLAVGSTESIEVVVKRGQQRLINNLAIASDAAEWAVQTWVTALKSPKFDKVAGNLIVIPIREAESREMRTVSEPFLQPKVWQQRQQEFVNRSMEAYMAPTRKNPRMWEAVHAQMGKRINEWVALHRAAVKKALADGKDVPPEVRSDHPKDQDIKDKGEDAEDADDEVEVDNASLRQHISRVA